MAFTGNLPLTLIDEVRLKVADIDPDQPILGDDIYQYYLDKCLDNVRLAAKEAAGTILMYLARYTRERTGNIEVYGSEWASNYRKALELFLKDPNLSDIAPVPYAGGISISDMQANRDNLDNVVSGIDSSDCCSDVAILRL